MFGEHFDPDFEFDAPTTYNPEEFVNQDFDDGADAWFDAQNELGQGRASSAFFLSPALSQHALQRSGAGEERGKTHSDTQSESGESSDGEEDLGCYLVGTGNANDEESAELNEETEIVKRQSQDNQHQQEYRLDEEHDERQLVDVSVDRQLLGGLSPEPRKTRPDSYFHRQACVDKQHEHLIESAISSVANSDSEYDTDASFAVHGAGEFGGSGYSIQHAAASSTSSTTAVPKAQREFDEFQGDAYDLGQSWTRPLTTPRSPQFSAQNRALARKIWQTDADSRDYAANTYLRVKRARTTATQEPAPLTVPKTPNFASVARSFQRARTQIESAEEKTRRLYAEARAARMLRTSEQPTYASAYTRKAMEWASKPKTDRRLHSQESFRFEQPSMCAHSDQPNERYEPTQLSEFQFATAKRSWREFVEPREFISEAEKLKAFEATGLRQGEMVRGQSFGESYYDRALTVPQSPRLISRSRSRQDKSVDEDCERQVRHTKRVDHRALESDRSMRLKEEAWHGPTIPVEVHLRCDERARRRERSEDGPNPWELLRKELAQRRAEAHKRILAEAARASAAPRTVTIPESPALLTRKRFRAEDKLHSREELRMRKRFDEPNPEASCDRPLTLTIPEDFSLRTEVRGAQRRARLEDENARAHKATEKPVTHPIRACSEPHQVESQGYQCELTIPKTPKLKVDERGAKYQEDFRIFVDSEKLQQHEKREFRAKPYIEKISIPRVPLPKPLTEVSEFRMNTANRAEERLVYEQRMAVKAAREAERAAQRAAEEADRTERELKAYRRALMPKANPIDPRILYAQPPPPARSDLPVTIPQSPRFATNFRFGRRNEAEM